MVGVKIVVVRDFEIEKTLTKMKKDNYLDGKIDLRNMEGRERYVTMRFWRKKPIKKKVGRPKNNEPK